MLCDVMNCNEFISNHKSDYKDVNTPLYDACTFTTLNLRELSTEANIDVDRNNDNNRDDRVMRRTKYHHRSYLPFLPTDAKTI